MKQNRALGLFAVTVFAVVIAMSFTNALSIRSTNVPTTANYRIPTSNQNNLLNTIKGTYTLISDVNLSDVHLSSDFGNLTFSQNDFFLQANQSKNITVTFNYFPNNIGNSISGTITAANASTTASRPFSIQINSDPNNPPEIINCLQQGNPGNVDVRKIDLTNNGIENANGNASVRFGDSNTWYPFENLSASIETRNNGRDNVNNIELDWGLWDTSSHQWAIIPDSLKNSFDLSNGKSRTYSTDFQINDNMDEDLADLNSGGNYILYAIAKDGEVQNSTEGYPKTCAFDSYSASISLDDDFVVLTNLQMPTTTQCSTTVTGTADVWNIGTSDENSVSVHLYSNSLDIGQQTIPVGDLNSFDSRQISFSFQVPAGAAQKTYPITFDVINENGDVFQNNNNANARFNVPLQVQGSCKVTPQTTISASLVSGGQAGQDLVVSGTITNTASSTQTYTLSASGFSPWASSFTVDQPTITLGSGQSKAVTFTFPVNNDVSGTQTFNIEAVSGSNVTSQPVQVQIQAAPSLFGNLNFGGNAAIWIIGILNLILVIVIIIVAVKVSKR